MSSASALASPAVSPAASPRALRVVIEEKVRIPAEVVDLESFCRWATSEEYPQSGHFSYFHGEIWVDLSMEEMYSHNRVKTKFTQILATVVEEASVGILLADRMLLRNSAADLSTEPDALFVSYDALQSGRVTRVRNARQRILQLDGTPEMVLEIVSDTSVQKDTVELRDLYWRAGVTEYWLVDVRDGNLTFDVLKHGSKGYTPTRRQAGGWLKSTIFNRSFRLTQQTDPLGDPVYQLEVR